MPLPAVVPAVGAGIGVGKKLFKAGKGLLGVFKKKRKPPTAQPTQAAPQKQRGVAAIVNAVATVVNRTPPPNPLTQVQDEEPVRGPGDTTRFPEPRGPGALVIVAILILLFFFLKR